MVIVFASLSSFFAGFSAVVFWDDQSDGDFSTVRIRHSQHTDLAHVRVIPNQDLQFVPGAP